jgi:hypothetical protein
MQEGPVDAVGRVLGAVDMREREQVPGRRGGCPDVEPSIALARSATFLF